MQYDVSNIHKINGSNIVTILLRPPRGVCEVRLHPGGAAQPKCGVACSKIIWCGIGGQKWENGVESCGHKIGVKLVRVGVIWQNDTKSVWNGVFPYKESPWSATIFAKSTRIVWNGGSISNSIQISPGIFLYELREEKLILGRYSDYQFWSLSSEKHLHQLHEEYNTARALSLSEAPLLYCP